MRIFICSLAVLCLLSCNCNNGGEKPAETTTEAAASDTGPKKTAFPSPLEVFEIPGSVADGMVKYYSTCAGQLCQPNKKGMLFDRQIMDELNQKFPPANIRRIDARYRAEDVKRYINTRNRTGKAGEVEGYITELIVATDPETEIVYYYDFALLCPPPEPCDREMPSKDSLTSIDTSRKSK